VEASSVTVGIPVSDLVAARAWYESFLQRDAPGLEPVEGVVEYDVGGCWLQLSVGPTAPTDWILRIGVADVHAERERLVTSGVDVGPIETIEGVIAFCDLRDPDGNQLSLYTLL
jgi:predicted enzyme related to lactoylglutathione lyase